MRNGERDLNVVVLGSLPAVSSCLSDRHVSLERCPHVPEPLWVLKTKEDRKREKNICVGWGGRDKTEKGVQGDRRGKNMCWLSHSGAFLPRLFVGSLVVRLCPSLFEERLALTHTQHPPSMEFSVGCESSHTSKSIRGVCTGRCRVIILYGPTHTCQLCTD